MLRLGLQLTLRSGREGLVRLLVTTAAVAVGVALLLGVLAELHAFETNAYQQCWSCTTGANVPSALPSHGELWNSSVDYFQGQTLKRLDVAALGRGAPVPPGVSHLPAPGTYYASPALKALLTTVPADELGDRFPGRLAGTIGQAALNGSNDLAIYVGYQPAALANIAGTHWVTSIFRGAPQQVFTPFFRDAFYAGVLAVLFPMLVLISTATRLAADRREERFAAMRLVGGTPSDIRLVASVESVVGAFGGAVLGTLVFLLVRPALAGAALVGTPYFESDLTPTVWGYLAMLVGVPAAAAVAALISLRRVQISPLGATRRATPKPPTVWRLTLLVLGLALYVYGLWHTTRKSIGGQAYPGLLLTMAGLVVAGPWLTSVAARLFGRLTGGTSALLATRRLSGNPRPAFRSVTGLVLAVFLGTMVGALVPAVNSTEATPTAGALSNILLDQVAVASQPGQHLITELDAIKGATAYPVYAQGTPQNLPTKGWAGDGVIISCAAMRGLAVLGQCAPGLTAVQTSDGSLFGDNPRYDTAPIVSSSDPGYPGDLGKLWLQAVLVRVNGPATLERVRTYLTLHTAPVETGDPNLAPTPPRTFGETLAIRIDRATTVEQIVYAAVALTLVVAGCSLAVAAGGGLVERKRPFTLLRVSGTQVGVLTGVVLLEAAVPLVAATLLAAGIAYGTSILAFVRLAPPGTAIPQLGAHYYTLMSLGLAVAFCVITVTLPLLRRMTAPSGIRFE